MSRASSATPSPAPAASSSRHSPIRWSRATAIERQPISIAGREAMDSTRGRAEAGSRWDRRRRRSSRALTTSARVEDGEDKIVRDGVPYLLRLGRFWHGSAHFQNKLCGCILRTGIGAFLFYGHLILKPLRELELSRPLGAQQGDKCFALPRLQVAVHDQQRLRIHALRICLGQVRQQLVLQQFLELKARIGVASRLGAVALQQLLREPFKPWWCLRPTITSGFQLHQQTTRHSRAHIAQERGERLHLRATCIAHSGDEHRADFLLRIHHSLFERWDQALRDGRVNGDKLNCMEHGSAPDLGRDVLELADEGREEHRVLMHDVVRGGELKKLGKDVNTLEACGFVIHVDQLRQLGQKVLDELGRCGGHLKTSQHSVGTAVGILFHASSHMQEAYDGAPQGPAVAIHHEGPTQ
eukprot:scaffold244763_cov30-Tisochrysis_lutea.AAC.4